MSNMKMRDEQMIFLISLPRSGSTMLQKMLGCHSEIYTRSEPWLMLHPLFALKKEGIKTNYNSKTARDGLVDFISNLPNGEKIYYKAIEECYLKLYKQYLLESGKNKFLDKTPRYFKIFDELQLTFPNAKFIILYRNPLAVLSSIINTWIKDDWEKLKNYKIDLTEGIEFLLRDFTTYKNTYSIRYEDLLNQPDIELKSLFEFLNVKNEQECVTYGNSLEKKWKHGDPVTVYEKISPDSSHINKWQISTKSPKKLKIISEYLNFIGKEKFEKLGYDYDNYKEVINVNDDAKTDNLKNYFLDDFKIIENLMNEISDHKTLLKAEIDEVEKLKKTVLINEKMIEENNKLIEELLGINTLLKSRIHDEKNNNDLLKEHLKKIELAYKLTQNKSFIFSPYKKIISYIKLLKICGGLFN